MIFKEKKLIKKLNMNWHFTKDEMNTIFNDYKAPDIIAETKDYHQKHLRIMQVKDKYYKTEYTRYFNKVEDNDKWGFLMYEAWSDRFLGITKEEYDKYPHDISCVILGKTKENK